MYNMTCNVYINILPRGRKAKILSKGAKLAQEKQYDFFCFWSIMVMFNIPKWCDVLNYYFFIFILF